MPTRIDSILLQVTAGALDLSPQCLDVTIRLGYDLRVSECEITLTSLATTVAYWDALVIHAGTHSTGGDTASDIAGQANGIKRFDGYVTDINFDDWPNSVKLKGNGPLVLAQRMVVQADSEALHASLTVAEALAIPSKYDAPGIDMSANPDTNAPWTDADMVTWVLGQCGLAGRIDAKGIGGTGHILGSLAFDQFVWRRGQSALSFIEDLEKVCLGFRTFEVLGGTIARANTSPRAPFELTVYTFLEGTDVGFDAAQATLGWSALEIRNRAVVQGYDAGGGPEVAVVIGAVSTLPPGILYDSIELSSPMIENSFTADGGTGLACDEVANWLLAERAYPILEGPVPTWRDDPFSPGQVIYLNAPALAVNQSMWLKAVEIRVTSDSFTQTLTLKDRAQRDRAGNLTISSSPALPLTAPASMTVNP